MIYQRKSNLFQISRCGSDALLVYRGERKIFPKTAKAGDDWRWHHVLRRGRCSMSATTSRPDKMCRLVLSAILVLTVVVFAPVVKAHAASSTSKPRSFNHYVYYSMANTVRKSISSYVKVDCTKGANVRCVGGNPRIYIAPRGSLKKSGGFTFNSNRVSAGSTWSCRVSAKTVAGISYYAKGQFKFGKPGGYYGPYDTQQTGNLKAIV